MTVTKVEMCDLEAILALQYRAYQSEAALVGDFSIPPLTQTLSDMETEYRESVFLKAAEPNNGIDGGIIGSVRVRMDGETAHIDRLIVHPDRQGQGIGTKLLLAAEQHCPAARYELYTSSKSVRNLRLYERLGYVRFKEEPVAPDWGFVYLAKSGNL